MARTLKADGALDLIAKYESGGRNIEQGVVGPSGGYNPSVGRVTGPSSASGPWQMIDPTWRSAASAVGIDTNQYPRAITAPVELQRKAAQFLFDTQGFKPWAPYNAKLRSALGSGETAAPVTYAETGDPQFKSGLAVPTAAPVEEVPDPARQAALAALALQQTQSGPFGSGGLGAPASLGDAFAQAVKAGQPPAQPPSTILGAPQYANTGGPIPLSRRIG